MGMRRGARELAVQILFHMEFNQGDPDTVFDLICENFNSKKSVRGFARQLVLGVCEKRQELDKVIGRASKNWRLERMSRLDKCVLRLAVFEMFFLDDIPLKVSLDEAVEIGKKFGGEDSTRFINGVLDSIYTQIVDGH